MHTHELQIWIFSFTGTSNRNYSNWLLELYCLLRYESSKDLSNGILNNWLVNLEGELGKWLEADLLQEHYNRWLEDMAGKTGGEFDDKFYRHTLSPNVNHFLRVKEEIESAFGISPRSKAHGSAHLRDEFQSLLRMHKEDQLHLFRPKRSMGHAVINTFDRGYKRLDEGRIRKFLKQSLPYAKILKDMKLSETPRENLGETDDNIIEEEDSDSGNDDDDDENEQYRPTAEQQVETGTHRIMFIEPETGEVVIDSGGEDNESCDDDSDDDEDNEEETVGGDSDDDDLPVI